MNDIKGPVMPPSPTWKDEVPLCNEHCHNYDGRRCGITGVHPSQEHLCKPEVQRVVQLLKKVAKSLEGQEVTSEDDVRLPLSASVIAEDATGTFFGTMVAFSAERKSARLNDARQIRMYLRSGRGAFSERDKEKSELPVYGPGEITRCFAIAPSVVLLNVHRVALCTELAAKRLKEAPEWTEE